MLLLFTMALTAAGAAYAVSLLEIGPRRTEGNDRSV